MPCKFIPSADLVGSGIIVCICLLNGCPNSGRTQLVKHKSKKNGRVLNLIDEWAGKSHILVLDSQRSLLIWPVMQATIWRSFSTN